MEDVTRFHAQIARIADRRSPHVVGAVGTRGIITCAGGRTLFTCAWVLVNVLRELGCRLSIEVWYRGKAEMSDAMRELLETIPDVRCIDAFQYWRQDPAQELNGWELKAYAIRNTQFGEVLFLDADNLPVCDPTYLFDTPEYICHGALFWPDRYMKAGDPHRTMLPGAWLACDVEERDEPEFEAGQMLIDKSRCAKALELAGFFNDHSSFFYTYLFGDKDTFHMAWRRVGQKYAMPIFRPVQDWHDGPVLYQHDMLGRRVFQHRNHDKWRYEGGNQHLRGFVHEDLCFEYVAALRHRWDGVVRRFPSTYGFAEIDAINDIRTQRWFEYCRIGYDARPVELLDQFLIGRGGTGHETNWDVEARPDGSVRLLIMNSHRKLCVLKPDNRGRWAGNWLHFERMPVILRPWRRMRVRRLVRAGSGV